MGELFNYQAMALCSRFLPRRLSYALGHRVADWCHAHDAAGRQGVMANLRRVFAFQGRRVDERVLEHQARLNFRYFSQYLVDFFAYADKEGVKKDEKGYAAAEKLIKSQLKGLIAQKLWDMTELYTIINQYDEEVLKAIEVVEDDALYQKLKIDR